MGAWFECEKLSPERPASQSIVFFVKRNWAELDAGLPMLLACRRARPDWRLIAIFESAWMHQEQARFPALLTQLRSTADVCLWTRHAPASGLKIKRTAAGGSRRSGLVYAARVVGWRLWAPVVAHSEVRALARVGEPAAPVGAFLHNHKAETPLERRLHRAFPGAVKIGFHHGSHPVVPAGERACEPKPSKGPPTDLFLGKTLDERDLVRFPGSQPDVRAVGFPKYDSEWLRSITASTWNEGPKPTTQKRHGRRWLFLTRGPVNEAMDPGDYTELLNALADALARRPDVQVLVKPHPREDLEALRAALPGQEGERWHLTNQHPYIAAKEVDLTIAMWSSVILDAAAAGSPVIELYRFRHASHYLAYLPNGRLASTHAATGICEPASNHEELERAIAAWESSGWDDPVWLPKRRAIAGLLGSTPGKALDETRDAIDSALSASPVAQ